MTILLFFDHTISALRLEIRNKWNKTGKPAAAYKLKTQ
jgi:hypothetical protein